MCLRNVSKGLEPPGVSAEKEEQWIEIEDEAPGGLWEAAGMLGPTGVRHADCVLPGAWAEEEAGGERSSPAWIAEEPVDRALAGRLSDAGSDAAAQPAPHDCVGPTGKFWKADDDEEDEPGEKHEHYAEDETIDDEWIASPVDVEAEEKHSDTAWEIEDTTDEELEASNDEAEYKVEEHTGTTVKGAEDVVRPRTPPQRGTAADVVRSRTPPQRLITIPVNMVEAAYRAAPKPRAVVRASPFTTGLLARMALRGGVRAPKPKAVSSWMDALLDPIFG